jgi:hypothetical protein
MEPHHLAALQVGARQQEILVPLHQSMKAQAFHLPNQHMGVVNLGPKKLHENVLLPINRQM